METIPLNEESSGLPALGNPAPLDTNAEAQEPLTLQALEDRVPLASDAAAAIEPRADIGPVEPAAYISAQQPSHLAIELPDDLDASDASCAGVSQEQGGVPPGQRSAHAVVAHAEAEPVDRKSDEPKAEPEGDGHPHPHSEDGELALATIEPKASKAPRAQSLEKKLVAIRPESKSTNEVSDETVAASLGEGGNEAIVNEVAVKQLAEELTTGLVTVKPIEPELKSAVAKTPLASEARSASQAADEQVDAIVHTILQAETVSESEPIPAAVHTRPAIRGNEAENAAIDYRSIDTEGPATHLTDAAAAGSHFSQSEVRDSHEPEPAQQPAAVPPAAHDAFFAGGSGVEAVFKQAAVFKQTVVFKQASAST